MKQRLVRRAQTLSPFGVGAIIDIESESLVAADITRWKNRGEEIREPRLEQLLGVTKFKMGPAAPDNPWNSSNSAPGIPYFRFPQWLFCSRCRRMIRWSYKRETGRPPECNSCARTPKPRLVPMRFVMACPRGHLADVPWGMWAHSRAGKCEKHMLEFRTKPGGSGLEYISIHCRTCGAERSLGGIASPDSLMELKIRCPGLQPWETEESGNCDAVPQVLQRGATNLTFAITTSSIDIPPYSDYSSYSSDNLRITSMPEFEILKGGRSNPIRDHLINLMADKAGMTREKVQSIVNAELRVLDAETASPGDEDNAENDLLSEEFNAFLAPDIETDPRDRFIKRRVSLDSYLAQNTNGLYQNALRKLADLFDALVQVTRLREVRVLRGFSRLAPVVSESEEGEGPGTFSVYGTPLRKVVPSLIPADLGILNHADRWLPAIEVYGEGIFLSLSEMALQEWESNPYVQSRIQLLKNRHNRSKSFLPAPTPRLLLLHTFAHILIRQLSFECGYSLASLRERIYAAEPGTGHPMAGILIYTAAGDAEGTLGGLVREGEPDRILSTITMALQTAEWCSSDPLCRESRGQGMDAMNLAACHACALLPETGCILSNRLLDRTLLLGSTDNALPGFFSPLMEQLMPGMGEENWRM